MEFAGVIEILGGVNVVQKDIKSQMDLIELSNEGVTKDAMLHLAKYLGFSTRQMADLLATTERTIQRHTLQQHFNRLLSEQILHIAEVAAKGTHLFENKNKFLLWMKQPNKALANKTPVSLLNSRFGIEMVLDELGRIEHGVFS